MAYSVNFDEELDGFCMEFEGNLRKIIVLMDGPRLYVWWEQLFRDNKLSNSFEARDGGNVSRFQSKWLKQQVL